MIVLFSALLFQNSIPFSGFCKALTVAAFGKHLSFASRRNPHHVLGGGAQRRERRGPGAAGARVAGAAGLAEAGEGVVRASLLRMDELQASKDYLLAI